MTFREFDMKGDLPSLYSGDAEAGLWQTLTSNISPVMKAWFVLMLLNLVLVLMNL